jgi:peptide/nickel transport system substrate-binding protein
VGRFLQRRRWALAVAASALAAGLGAVVGAARGPVQPTAGGTLRVGMPLYHVPLIRTPAGAVDQALEPAADLPVPLELSRCCLLRTLLSYNGKPTAQGGAVLRPDLAEAAPTQSRDGLTWTFHLKRGLRYGPPLDGLEITSQDVIRAIKRAVKPPPALLRARLAYPPDLFGPIVGLNAYRRGRVSSISGLEAPDAHTLVVTLERPDAELGYSFSLPFTAPVPAPALAGHSPAYSRFLVSTGPYMIAGSEAMDFARPPDRQAPAAGYRPGHSITLVRNPSWVPATDSLRAAYVDARKVDRGRLDAVFDATPPEWQMAEYRARAALRARLRRISADALYLLAMNVAVPPFDDPHVRRAVNLAVDKARLLRLYERAPAPRFTGSTGVTAGHLIVDSLEGNLNHGWDPYGTPGARGSAVRARREMRRSGYDRDRDGRCDAAACTGVVMLARAAADDEPFWPLWAETVRRNLAGIGIRVDVRSVPPDAWSAGVPFDRARRWPLILGLRAFKDFPSAWTYAVNFDGAAPGGNVSMLGASRSLLHRLGYRVTRVPSADDRIRRCRAEVGEAGIRCWTELDRYLMQRVVPWVPLVFQTTTRALSGRVVSFSFDQLSNFPALDRVAVTRR